MRQIILDTETTGLMSDQGDRVVEIGCVELLRRQHTHNHFHEYLNPERSMPLEAYRIHGLGDEFLADKPRFADIAERFIAYIKGADELIIHNAAFDTGFLNAELSRLKLPAIETLVGKVTDTVAMARSMFPGKRASLDALCDRFGVNRGNRTLHGALLDSQLLAEVYIALTRGQDSLLDTDNHSDSNYGGSQTGATPKPKIQDPGILLQPSADELAAHEAILLAIDKASQNQTLWRQAG